MIKLHGHQYLSAREYAAVYLGIEPDKAVYNDVRRIYHLLEGEQIEGAIKVNNVWIVPLETARHEVEAARQLAIAKAAALAELIGVE